MIKTARTTIRPFVSSDLNDLQQILGDPVTMTYVEPPYTYEQTEHFLENFCIKRKAALACVHKDNNKLIGYLLFKSLGEADSNGHNDAYELGWIFNHAQYMREHLLREAVKDRQIIMDRRAKSPPQKHQKLPKNPNLKDTRAATRS